MSSLLAGAFLVGFGFMRGSVSGSLSLGCRRCWLGCGLGLGWFLLFLVCLQEGCTSVADDRCPTDEAILDCTALDPREILLILGRPHLDLNKLAFKQAPQCPALLRGQREVRGQQCLLRNLHSHRDQSQERLLAHGLATDVGEQRLELCILGLTAIHALDEGHELRLADAPVLILVRGLEQVLHIQLLCRHVFLDQLNQASLQLLELLRRLFCPELTHHQKFKSDLRQFRGEEAALEFHLAALHAREGLQRRIGSLDELGSLLANVANLLLETVEDVLEILHLVGKVRVRWRLLGGDLALQASRRLQSLRDLSIELAHLF
mmetsp:Transcript_70470/g.178637  ORF Transcript_70470/g.178637 Transcript_70470/m.178637 type:complete len:320 (+) Transcript_70470:329-1288(+)